VRIPIKTTAREPSNRPDSRDGFVSSTLKAFLEGAKGLIGAAHAA
jgi:hypothetical protein